MFDKKVKCEECDLPCKFREWALQKREKNEKYVSSEYLRAISKRNPLCPNDEGRYNELMRECQKRASFDESLQVCTRCKNRSKLISMADLEAVPNNCPMLDPVKSAAQQLSEISVVSSSMYLKMAKEITQAIEYTQRKYVEIMRGLIESTRFLNEKDFQLFERGLGFLPSFLSITDTKLLYDLWKEGKEDAVKGFFVKMLRQKESMDFLISELTSFPSFKSRIGIIKDALYAHIEGKYSLSIPVLWSQIDGIFIKKFGSLVEVRYCNQCGHPLFLPNVKSISKELIAKKDSPFWSRFLSFAAEIYGKERHKILHGLDIDYPDPERSTKLVLALFELFNYIKNLEEDRPSH